MTTKIGTCKTCGLYSPFTGSREGMAPGYLGCCVAECGAGMQPHCPEDGQVVDGMVRLGRTLSAVPAENYRAEVLVAAEVAAELFADEFPGQQIEGDWDTGAWEIDTGAGGCLDHLPSEVQDALVGDYLTRIRERIDEINAETAEAAE